MNYLLVGRTNVGKSSIFNILTGQNNNIVHKDEKTTRDWHKDRISKTIDDYIYDTPGLFIKSKKIEEKEINNIILKLIPKIDVFFFVIDYSSINNIEDQIIINWLRKFNKKIILIVNKNDNFETNNYIEFYKLGIKDFFHLSCIHKKGFKRLNEFLSLNSKKINTKNISKFKNDYSIAIFGKPNSGKSTFLNTLLGYKRSLISEKAGTTSDFVSEEYKYKSKTIKFFDTAGIGRKSKVLNNSINFFAIQKSLNKITEVNTSLILIDISKMIDRQDKRIINLVSNNSKNLLIIFNKIDLIQNKQDLKKKITLDLENQIHQLKNIKLFFISAKSKSNIMKIINYILDNILLKNLEISTNKINLWLKNCINNKQHPLVNKRKINFKYAVKVKNSPITIKVFCNNSNKVTKSYTRYLQNNFNSYFKVLNQKTKFIFSSSKNPFI